MSINQENKIKTINLTDLKYNKIKKVIEEVSEILSEIFTKTANNIIKFAKSTNDVFEDDSLTIEQRTEMLRQMELLIDDTPDEEILITDEEIGIGVEDEI